MSPVKLREANEWLVRLRNEAATAADREAFEDWLDADPRHREAYARAAGALANMSGVSADLRSYLETRRSPGLGRIAFAPAATLAAALILLAWFGFAALSPKTYATAIGEQRTIALADGSRVELNTSTRLSVRYSEGARRIRIERGEAVFNVVRDPRRAFVVEARGQSVRAVGTQFAVRVDPNAVSVLVIEGIVAVSATRPQTPAAPVVAPRLVAGQKLDLTGETRALSTLPATEIERNLAWRSGWLEFNGQPLAAAASEVARYTDARFVIDPQVRDLQVWAYFRVADLDGFLSSLEQNSPTLRIERDDDGVRISRRDPDPE